MTTICPPTYTPFIKRVGGILKLIGTLMLFIIVAAIISRPPGNDWLAFISLFGGLGVFLSALFCLSQVWVLDKVIIDEEKRKIRILIRKFNKIVDKGEYNIDTNLKITIKAIKNAPIGNYRFRIKYGKKRIFGFETTLGNKSNWSYDLSLSIVNSVNTVLTSN
jgi:hypothetical protein